MRMTHKFLPQCNTSNHSTKIKSLQECLTSVQDWMLTNKLKLNLDKTEFMLIGNKGYCNKFDSNFPVDILNILIAPAAHLRILAYTLILT